MGTSASTGAPCRQTGGREERELASGELWPFPTRACDSRQSRSHRSVQGSTLKGGAEVAGGSALAVRRRVALELRAAVAFQRWARNHASRSIAKKDHRNASARSFKNPATRSAWR